MCTFGFVKAERVFVYKKFLFAKYNFLHFLKLQEIINHFFLYHFSAFHNSINRAEILTFFYGDFRAKEFLN